MENTIIKPKRARLYDITIVRSVIVASTVPRLNYIARKLNK